MKLPSNPTVVLLAIAVVLLVLAAFAGTLLSLGGERGRKRGHERERERERGGGEHGGRRGVDVLVLDLDETLVHSLPPDHTVVVERPHVHRFLSEVVGMFDEVVVFTAATREYADPILDRLDPSRKIFGRRFFRDDCTVVVDGGGGESVSIVKDLRKLGIPEAELGRRVRIVDNTPSAYALQPQCGVPIKSFMGDDANDRELLVVLERLAAERRRGGPGIFF